MGVSPKGAKVHVIIAAWPWGAYLGEEGMQRGIRIKTSSYTRHHVNITMVRAKASGNYMNSILANNEATGDGYDEALLLDPEGYVCEGAGENIFIVRNGKLYTRTSPPAWKASPAPPSCNWPANWASRSSRSASPATKSIVPTKPSSPAPPPK
jgi:branched-subunit amino acid aminotransferase/4-amino-4-deoxychorismate lyase